MTVRQVVKFSEAFEDEYGQFDRIKEDKPSSRKDLCAFIKLDHLVPPAYKWEDIVTGSEHDEFFLSPDMDKFAKVATETDVLYLVRCGVMFSEDGMSMFS
jgi:hypothetical protein